MNTLIGMLQLARNELACERCGNRRAIMTAGGGLSSIVECPECHGNQRNPHTIALLEALVYEINGKGNGQ